MIEFGNLALSTDPCEDLVEIFRHEAHEAMDDFVDKLAPLIASEKRLTLDEVSETFQQKRAELMGTLVEKFIESHHADLIHQDVAPCPRCKKLLKARKQRARDVETMHGTVEIGRPYFYCPECHEGFSPLDAALELSKRKKQNDLQRKALKLLSRVPFDAASELFLDLTGIPFSDHSLHELFASFADQIEIEEVIPSSVEIEERIKEVSTSRNRPILVVASDGAMVPTRCKGGRDVKRGPGEYKEAKGFRLYLISKDRIAHLASWHQIQDTEQFGRDLKLISERIPKEKVRIALIGDGASWLWTQMKEAFPGAREILDLYHCSEHLHALANAQFPNDPTAALHWVEATMARLYFGKISDVIGGLRRMKPVSPDAKEEIRKLATYLQNNRGRIHYRSDRLGGYPIGSGGIESANKFICHARLKISGAWWLKTNSNAMLKLRCSIFNGTFNEVFANHVTQKKAKQLLTDA